MPSFPARVPLLLALFSTPASAQTGDVVFVATPMEVAIGMLNLAGVADTDVVYDLGSGDGRIVIAAARYYGARGVGIDIDSNLVEESRRSADTAGVSRRAEFCRGDLFETDLSAATVVTLYLGRILNERLRPNLFRDLRPGSRVVSQNFDMGDWEPDSVVIVRGRNFGETPVHLWIIPADVEGTWTVTVDGEGGEARRLEMTLMQRYQQLAGGCRWAGGPACVVDARLRGERLILRVETARSVLRFDGGVTGDTARGTVATHPGGVRSEWHATRVGRRRAKPR